MISMTPQPVILNSLDEPVYRAGAVLAGIQLDLFTVLKEGPLTASQIAEITKVDVVRLRPLLYALVIVGLIIIEEGLFTNSAEADYYLVRGRPAYRGDEYKFFADAWQAVLKTGDSIRSGRPQAKHDYATMSEPELEDFLQGLYPGTFDLGLWLAEHYDFTSCRTILDVGGGSGALAIALTQSLPQLQGTVIELPTVVPITRRFVTRAGASDRVQVESADLVREPLKGVFDAACLKAFLQIMSFAEARQALLHIRQALNPGAALYILDFPLDDSRLSPAETVLSNLFLLNIYDFGQKYTVQEYKDLLAETGFENFEIDAKKVITVRKPAA